MKSVYLLLVIVLASLVSAEETTFRDVQFPTAKGSLTNASLAFNDQQKQVELRVSDGRSITLPYAQIEKVTYEYTKKHRIEQGVGIGLLSPGTGIIVALTRSKNHWLEFDFRDQNTPKVLFVKLDKKDYKQVCGAAKNHIGKEVEMAGRTSTKTIKAKIK